MTDSQQTFVLLDRFIEQQMQAANIPGLALAVTDRERLLHVATYGYAERACQRSVRLDTLFQIGSIGKSFTAILLLQLHEAGRVDLHAPVTRYLPWFHIPLGYAQARPYRHEPITLHHLLSHTAGLIKGTEFTGEARYEVWALRQTEATAPPGTSFHYSNVGYKALGLVLEELLDQSYGEIVQERILSPLGMDATEPTITHETRKRLAVGYESFYDDRPSHPRHPLVPATWLEAATADGAIATSAADMATYLRMLINGGRGPQGRILSADSFHLMTQPVIEVPDEKTWFYGYGLQSSQDEDRHLIGHTGGVVGYYAAILADLDDGLGVVILMNGPGEPGQIAEAALKLLRAAHHGRELPDLLPIPEPTRIENAADYAGMYREGDRSFTLAAEGERLVMHYGRECISLELRGEDRFYVPHPEFALFLLCFGRDKGQIVEAFHGPRWYVHDRVAGPATFAYPPEWDAYPGHYRSHNPWYTNFRVVLRKGGLVLIEPGGDEEALVPLGNGVFRVGADERSPERLRLGTVLDGQTIRANLSCCDYYRTFTP